MSLVAYEASSDEDSDQEETVPAALLQDVKKQKQCPATIVAVHATSDLFNGQISDDDEDFAPIEVGLQDLKKSLALSLPAPKKQEKFQTLDEELEDNITPTFAKLPMPRVSSTAQSKVIVEEDDEFLHRKADAANIEKPPAPPIQTLNKGPVKISIPSLSDFSDVDRELAHKAKSKTKSVKAPKGSGLMSILPQAKSEQDFSKAPSVNSNNENVSTCVKSTTFIPDTVKNRRPAQNTEGVDGLKLAHKKPTTINPKCTLVDCSDSEASDNEDESAGGDFFSLNSDKTLLPEISANEINSMVAKRAAKMAEASNKFFNSIPAATAHTEKEQAEDDEETLRNAQKRYHEQLDAQAMQALVGSSSKRRRRQQADIHVMDISSAQVLPDRDEWMRTALATSTTYQPTGVLTDEEPASGTRRKHQITYLAHKAKANEAELQAMWAANRQTRRATQSKYGF